MTIELQVSAMLCQGNCPFNKHPNMFSTLIEADNSCRYLTEWVTQHLQECDGPTIANLVGGGSSIYMPNRNPKVVFPNR